MDEDQLVLFLVLFLFYAAYFMLRFSVDAGSAARESLRGVRALRRRARSRSASSRSVCRERFIHPVAFDRHGAEHGRLAVLHVLRLAGRRCSRSLRRSTTSSSPGKRLDVRLRELREALR